MLRRGIRWGQRALEVVSEELMSSALGTGEAGRTMGWSGKA
jgi:hypothetical protein